MCGIAGYIRFAGLAPHERGRGAVMARTLGHRGPDQLGHFQDHCASLGHTRLSVIDPAGGQQPMSNEDGSIQVVFNGEIYNHAELADRLRRRGHILRTRSDTEVIAHLYEEHGERFCEQLNGMFAIGLWDARRRIALLVRDRLGIKPLYYHTGTGTLAFGSELKALLALEDVPRDLNPAALHDYLTFAHVPAPSTIFRDVCKLEPGQRLIASAAGCRVETWWDIPLAPADETADTDPRQDQRWTDAFADLLQDAVRMRLIADVPLGAFLSGGVDSTAVVAAMHRTGAANILTHTVGFDDQDHDERALARETALRLGTDHREVQVRPDALEALHTLVGHFDEPFADASAVPTYYLSMATRERVTVALSGDGGDEMLAGYRRYRFDLAESAFRQLAPPWLRRTTLGLAGRLYPKADWLPRPLRAKRTLQNLACDPATAHLRSVALHAGELPGLLLRPDLADAADGHDPFARGRDLFHRHPQAGLLDRLLYLDMKTLMVDDILTKVDRASMAVALEVRVPLLDYRVVELAARMPATLKLRRQRGKHVLRETVGRWLGPRFADRPKHGFEIPLDAWCRGPLRTTLHDALLGPNARTREWLEPRTVAGLLAGHERGTHRHGAVLWTLLNLELWARTFAVPTEPAVPNEPRASARAESDPRTPYASPRPAADPPVRAVNNADTHFQEVSA